MKIKNLSRAAEIHQMLASLTEVRASLSSDAPFTVNAIELPHEMAYRFLQVINLEINQLREEAGKL